MTFINEDQNLNFFWGGWVITFNMYVLNINLKQGQYFKFSIHFETVFCHPNMMGKSQGTNKENIRVTEFCGGQIIQHLTDTGMKIELLQEL